MRVPSNLCCAALLSFIAFAQSERALSDTNHSTEIDDEACLCIFDIDRTLTGKQGIVGSRCQDNKETAIFDDAYGGGNLTLSQFSQTLSSTFCNECFVGVISAGDAGRGETKEEATLTRLLNASGNLLSCHVIHFSHAFDEKRVASRKRP